MSRVDGAAVAALEARIADEIGEQGSLAAQYALAVDGEVVASGAFGAADADTRFVIFSATKTFIAMALLPHLAAHGIGLTRRVAELIPEFGEQGKHETTILQLLTMQGGFPQAPMGPDRWGTSAGRREAFARWRLDWPSGTRTEYHPTSAHWVIAELIETLAGRPYQDEVNGLMRSAGSTPILGPHTHTVAPVRTRSERPSDEVLAAVFGRLDLVPAATVTPEALLVLNDPAVQAFGIPGGGGVTRAVDVVLAYQAFLHGNAQLPASVMADATGTIRNVSINVSDGTPANRTVAGVVAGEDGYAVKRWFPDAPRAFGHHGAGGQLCWLEPERGISFCFLHDTISLDPSDDYLRSRHLNALALACVSA